MPSRRWEQHFITHKRLRLLTGSPIIIVRDRASAGGGIHAYYQAIDSHLHMRHEFVDVGRPLSYYEGRAVTRRWQQSTLLRLFLDWYSLVCKLFKFPALVHVNPSLDTLRRSLKRDAASILLGKLFRRPVLVFWRGWDNDVCGTAQFPGGNKGIVSQIYRLADAHIVLANDFKLDLMRWKFSSPIYVETTVVPDEILNAGTERTPALTKPINLLFLSRIEIAKGVFELLDAFRILDQRQPGIYSLTIAGDGPDFVVLKQRAQTLGLRNVHFPGYVTGKAKIRCYSEASIFCFLSYTEGMPNAVLEALAMGLPVVSSDAGGLKDILRDGETGFFVAQNKAAATGERFCPQAIASSIERIAGEPDLAQRMSLHNRKYANERFAARKVAQRLETIYKSLLNDGVKESVKYPTESSAP